MPVTEFRAAIIVGSGSVSFEMIRYLTERIPAMICPRWVFTRVQPIGIGNVLEYLVAALETPGSSGRIIEIGGADVLTYGDMMLGYAHVRGLRRLLLPVPVLSPRLSSYWVHWMTPIPAEIARPLIEGLRNEVVVRNDTARRLFPDIQPIDYQTAVKLALANLEASQVETAWSDALVTSQQAQHPQGILDQPTRHATRTSGHSGWYDYRTSLLPCPGNCARRLQSVHGAGGRAWLAVCQLGLVVAGHL